MEKSTRSEKVGRWVKGLMGGGVVSGRGSLVGMGSSGSVFEPSS